MAPVQNIFCAVVILKLLPNKYKYLIVEGVFVFSDDILNKLFNLKIWVETSEYVCALRRMIKYSKDIQGYSMEFVVNQCVKYVIPGEMIIQKNIFLI